MNKVAVLTDSNSGITKEEAGKSGIHIVPMPFLINNESYIEGINLTHSQFYTLLDQGADVSTSQPSVGDLIDICNHIFETYDEIVYIPMSSELSSSCHSAIMAANEFDGKLQVVDNHRISVTLKQSVYDALMMAEQGNSAKEIKNKLESEAYEASIYITVDTLTYLKKGGRITPAGAAIGSVLNMKPVLTIQGGKLDAFAKVRGMKAARRTMVQAMKRDIETRLQKWVANDRLQLFISYSHLSDETIKGWYDEVAEAFPNLTIKSDPLTLSIGCHIGPGAIAIAACKTGDI